MWISPQFKKKKNLKNGSDIYFVTTISPATLRVPNMEKGLNEYNWIN